MHYILVGFRQEKTFRVFSFQRIESGQTSTNRTIRADIALAQKYDIRLQELPLLCRALIEQSQDAEGSLMTFTEEEMRLHQKRCADDVKLAQQRKKPARRPVPSTVSHPSTYWRSATANKTQPFQYAQPAVKE